MCAPSEYPPVGLASRSPQHRLAGVVVQLLDPLRDPPCSERDAEQLNTDSAPEPLREERALVADPPTQGRCQAIEFSANGLYRGQAFETDALAHV